MHSRAFHNIYSDYLLSIQSPDPPDDSIGFLPAFFLRLEQFFSEFLLENRLEFFTGISKYFLTKCLPEVLLLQSFRMFVPQFFRCFLQEIFEKFFPNYLQLLFQNISQFLSRDFFKSFSQDLSKIVFRNSLYTSTRISAEIYPGIFVKGSRYVSYLKIKLKFVSEFLLKVLL